MWFVFVLAPLAAGVVSTIVKTTGGAKFVTVGIGVMAWQKSRGYRAGEGQLTDRANNGKYWGVEPNIDSTYDLNQALGVLAGSLDKEFAPYIGKKFDMTKSEAEQLRAMVIPATDAAQQAEQAKAFLRRYPHPDSQDIAVQAFKQLKKAAHPVLVFLKQFPEKRVKDVAKNDHSR